MSVSDPLIKDIKGHTLKLLKDHEAHGKICENNKNLLNFFRTLEQIYSKGLITIHENKLLNFRKIDLIGWIYRLANETTSDCLLVYRTILDNVKSCKHLNSSIGKFRLLMRMCLMRKCLDAPLQTLMKSQCCNYFYAKNSILGDEILSTILLSVLLQCNKLHFELDVLSSAFLDWTWQVPKMVRCELVPCRQLGISVSFADNKAVIVNIGDGTVAAETEEIKRGDILATLNNVAINSSARGRLHHIFNLNKGKPVTLTIIKAQLNVAADNKFELFPPIKKLWDDLHLDYANNTAESLQQDKINAKDAGGNIDDDDDNVKSCSKDNNEIEAKPFKFGYEVNYMGCINVGNKGSIKQIEEAMRTLMSNNNNKKNNEASFDKKPMEKVWIEIGELCIKVFHCNDEKLIFKHSYMEISSCGTSPNSLNYFAYINGNANCETATEFTCHIFHAKDTDVAARILQSIGQGFHRTHFAV